MRRSRRGAGRVGALAAFVALGAGALAGTGVAAAGAAGAPGVTSTQVTTGAISTLSGTLASNFESLVPGIRAYFAMVNAQGGVNGRKLALTYSLDDGGNPSQFNQLAHTLIDQDHAFAAVGIATAFFSPNYLVATNTPTYGYNVTNDWAGPKNLFAAGGSVNFLPQEASPVAFMAKKLKDKSIAVLAYGIAASSDACQATVNGLKSAGYNVSYVDLKVAYPGSALASDVQRMQQAGSDLVVSCMDVTGNITMARAIQQYGLKAHQLWLSGNDVPTLRQYKSLMDGVYFGTSHVPFTADPKYYPGLATYLAAMKRYQPKYVQDEVALQGWESAALFAAGVKAAGRNLTQANVVSLTNKMTNFSADGLSTPVNWARSGHDGHTEPACLAFIQAKGTNFYPVFNTGHHVFLCFNNDPKHPVPQPAPPGTPGA